MSGIVHSGLTASIPGGDEVAVTLTAQDVARQLNGCEHRSEGSRELWAAMKAAGLVAVFGASDDLVELRGAIDDEIGCYGDRLVDTLLAALSPEAPAREGVDAIMNQLADIITEASVDYPAGRDAGHSIDYDEDAIRAVIEAALTPRHEAPAAVPADVARLVIAAREVAYGDRHRHGDDVSALDKAAEAFASRVPWEDEPDSHEAPAEGAGERGAAGVIMDGLWPILGGNHMDAEIWNEIGKVVSSALRARSSAPEAREGEVVGWRPVVGFEGHYEVSAFGDVRNIKTGKVLAKNTMGRGYIKAEFWKDGERTQTSVHRVVAEAFLPRRAGLDEVNHIDGDKANNAAWNLEWTNRKGNTDHSRYVLGNDVIAVLATDKVTGRQEYYPSIEEAGRYGYNASCIQMCLKGQREDHAGKLWTKTPFREPTHPAAPSAEKLRIAVEALEPFSKAFRGLSARWEDHETHWHDSGETIKVSDLRRASEAFASLETEGVK